MDLPSCPACGQSVLDENPETCPFCGASMSAKGGKASESGKKPAPPEKKKKQLTSKEEDPFAIETNTQKAAVRVALKKAQGRTHEVKCPMCETKGYVPESAAGKPVKCANPSCMVPIFEAPEVEREEEPVEEKAGPPIFMMVFGVVMLGAVGFAVWFFVLRTGEEEIDPNELVQRANPGMAEKSKPIEYNPVFEDDPKNDTKEEKDPFDAVAYRQQLLDTTIQSIARERTHNSQPNRPSDCRQLLAEAYARIGQLQNAHDQLPHIDKQNPEVFFGQRLVPLIEIAWREKDAAKRQSLLEEAERAAAQTPTAGRDRFDNLSGLAAVLVKEGRSADAEKWLKFAVEEANISDPERLDRLRQASAQMRVLRDISSYPISPFVDHPSHRWHQPEWITVTMLLLAHGEDAKAIEWVRRAKDDRVRADALLAYSRWKARLGEMSPDQLIELVKNEQPAAKTRILADAASFYVLGGQEDSAKKVLALAAEQLDKLTGGTEFLIPSAADLINLELPETSPILNRVLALSALSRGQAAIGENDKAWDTLKQAIALTRSIGPTPSAIAARPQNQNQPEADRIKQELREKLELTNDNDVRIRFNAYAKKLDELKPIAELRIKTLEALFREAILWGQSARVWQELEARIDETNENLKEPYLKSAILAEVKAALEADSATAQLKELERRTGSNLPARESQLRFLAEFDRMIAEKDFLDLAKAVNGSGIDRERLQLTLADRLLPLAEAGEFQLVVDALQSLPRRISATRMDLTVMKEELYYHVGRKAGEIGQPLELQQLVTKQLPAAVEEVSALSGICVGLDVTKTAATTALK